MEGDDGGGKGLGLAALAATLLRSGRPAPGEGVMGHAVALDRRRGSWPAVAAAVWGVAFGCLSFYWALGGHLGLGTLHHAIRDKALARDDGMILLVWVTGALKIALALVPLALVRRWHHDLPRRLVRGRTWVCGAVLCLYGGMGMVNGALSQWGVVEPDDADAARWYLVLWGPVWLVGGLLLLATLWRTRDGRTPAAFAAGEPSQVPGATNPLS